MDNVKKEPFVFKQIEGKLSLEEATEQLVHVAQCMQRTHTSASASVDKFTTHHLFNLRKASVLALLDLIEEYEQQKP